MIQLSHPATRAEFEAYYDLRWRELRAPWDQPRGSERDELEDSAWHVYAHTAAGAVVGVGRLHLNDDGTAQIRYMATDSRHTGKGIGSAIIHHLESVARDAGAEKMLINARIVALEFYEKLGYSVYADGDTIFGSIEHKRMHKRL